jgi:hypothetical protein
LRPQQPRLAASKTQTTRTSNFPLRLLSKLTLILNLTNQQTTIFATMKHTMPFTLLDLSTEKTSAVPLQGSNAYLLKLLGRLIAGGGGPIPGMSRWAVLVSLTDQHATIDIGYCAKFLAISGVLAWQGKHSLAAWKHATEMYASYELRPNDPDIANSLPNKPELTPWLATYIHAEIKGAVCPHEFAWIQAFLILLSTEIIARATARHPISGHTSHASNPFLN